MVRIGARSTLVPVLLAAALLLAGCTSAGSAVPAGGTTGSGASSASEPPDTGPISSEIPSTEPTSAQPPATSSAQPVVTQQVVQLAAGVSDEASGIAASTGTPGAYFLIDDGTRTSDIVAVGSDGGVLQRIGVDGMSARNAEALSAGPCGSTPVPDGSSAQTCVYVGDIGDNDTKRSDIVVYRIAEPDLGVANPDPAPSDEWHFTYPDGPQNAESMMVAADGSLIIVTKPKEGKEPHRIYRADPGGGQLTFVREFRPPPAEHPLRTLFTGNVVTDMASAPGRVLLLTYDQLTEYTAPDPAADITNFPDWPHHPLPAPSLPQAEGVTASADGCGYVLASEAGPGGKTGSMAIVSCG